MGVPIDDRIIFLYRDRIYWTRQDFEKEVGSTINIVRLLVAGEAKGCFCRVIPAKIAFEAGMPTAYYDKEEGEFYRSGTQVFRKNGKSKQWFYTIRGRFEPAPKVPNETSVKLLRRYFK